ncbi:MAG: nuclear transport factor 2 family protein [Solirubrobacteraceae bacterium]
MSNQDDNRQLLAEVFHALANGDARPFGEAMADDFRWQFAGQWTWVRDWGQNKREVQERMLGPLMAQFREYRATAEEILADGDRVVVRARGEATTKRGDAYPQAYCYVFTVRDGKLRDVIEYCDTALVERVLELPG